MTRRLHAVHLSHSRLYLGAIEQRRASCATVHDSLPALRKTGSCAGSPTRRPSCERRAAFVGSPRASEQDSVIAFVLESRTLSAAPTLETSSCSTSGTQQQSCKEPSRSAIKSSLRPRVPPSRPRLLVRLLRASLGACRPRAADAIALRRRCLRRTQLRNQRRRGKFSPVSLSLAHDSPLTCPL
jgi:hypothetical protein